MLYPPIPFFSSFDMLAHAELTRYSFVGTRTEKTLEAPCRTLLMDVGQVERYIRASNSL